MSLPAANPPFPRTVPRTVLRSLLTGTGPASHPFRLGGARRGERRSDRARIDTGNLWEASWERVEARSPWIPETAPAPETPVGFHGKPEPNEPRCAEVYPGKLSGLHQHCSPGKLGLLTMAQLVPGSSPCRRSFFTRPRRETWTALSRLAVSCEAPACFLPITPENPSLHPNRRGSCALSKPTIQIPHLR